jgi:RNA polymerase sigma-70 factor (ECF subfamily)
MNRIRDKICRSRRSPAPEDLGEHIPTDGTYPLDRAIGQGTVERYEAALAELRDEDREAIVARVELGQSWEEVAAMRDKPSPAAARVATQHALVRLAVKMNHAR